MEDRILNKYLVDYHSQERFEGIEDLQYQTREHSSRMHTAYFSGHH